jgi:hypothetical protein
MNTGRTATKVGSPETTMQEIETDFVIVDGVVVPESAMRREGWERCGESGEDLGANAILYDMENKSSEK